MTESGSSFLSEFDDCVNHYITKKHPSIYQRQRSVSFYDIDTVHYYNSDDCSAMSSSGFSDSSDEDNQLTSPSSSPRMKYEDIVQLITTLLQDQAQEGTPDMPPAPYTRLDMPYRIPCEHMEPLQEAFLAELDLVGEFFADVYMYEVWWRKV